MRTHKIIGAVEFLNDDGKKVGEVRGSAQNDAYAMAAAPDLLAACKDAMAEIAIMNVSSLPRYDQEHYLKAIHILDAARAKARGDQ